ncbi:ImmA/IrrE family metallo-endopeptidase [Vibrio sp. V39_P1S14PM300]|uniref:ImmA/IrrE family metallo-endopeptidase n=1 Tax=Vibrio sp. V39_P1S14PM300 TaxID=1938690 RepID=UPI0013725072|nr:ImmA/IrrE family metallo-endopeptidase [Vibrio sp. V39_P1S14PM300]NAX23654.1 ImmA/IrrE family metallo-endopeptidase [Vibrio sp. V39_P1S14PM300]
MAEQALINPRIVTWARQRAGLSEDALARKLNVKNVGKVVEWESGETRPTFKQAQNIANVTNIPFGYLFLPEPPQEELPIPDLRTVANRRTDEVSVDMKEIIRQVMLKQEWYRDYLIKLEAPYLPFIGKYCVKDSVFDVAQDIRKTLNVPLPQKGSWEEYHRTLLKGAEAARILVMRSGIVGNNTRRKLQVSEFRGFAISDDIAPVIFINSSDAPTARLFTLIHELAHLWIGSSGISDLEHSHAKEEKFCNAVAGEFLVPQEAFYRIWNHQVSLVANLTEINAQLHVSKLAAAKRALDCRVIDAETYWEYYRAELNAFRNKKGGQGNFNVNAGAKNSKLFSSAVVAEALSGRMLLRDASNLLGIKPNNIKTYARKLAL